MTHYDKAMALSKRIDELTDEKLDALGLRAFSEGPDTPYHEVDHNHCWEQGKSPACGIPLKWHVMCCLCAIDYKKRTDV